MAAVAAPPPLSSPFDGDAVHDVMRFIDKNVADSTAYFQACQRCPQVIQSESPHDQFLNFCSHNAIEAATRLAKYWTERVEAFGEAVAFKPLELQKDVLEIASRGMSAVVPPSEDGAESRPVYFVDRARVDRKTAPNEDVFRRLAFYLYQWIASLCYRQKKKNPRGEYVICMRIDPLVKTRTDAKRARVGKTLEIMCIRPAVVHICSIFPTKESKRALGQLMPVFEQRIANMYADSRIATHAGSKTEVIASLFSKAGLGRTSMPVTIGGNWTYEFDWQARLQERLVKPTKAVSLSSSLKAPPKNSVFYQDEQESATDVLKRIRERNIEYSRRKRVKQKERVDSLKQNAQDVQNENKRLKMENGRLTGLVQQAEQIVAAASAAQETKPKPVLPQSVVPALRPTQSLPQAPSRPSQQALLSSSSKPPPQAQANQQQLSDMRLRQQLLARAAAAQQQQPKQPQQLLARVAQQQQEGLDLLSDPRLALLLAQRRQESIDRLLDAASSSQLLGQDLLSSSLRAPPPPPLGGGAPGRIQGAFPQGSVLPAASSLLGTSSRETVAAAAALRRRHQQLQAAAQSTELLLQRERQMELRRAAALQQPQNNSELLQLLLRQQQQQQRRGIP